MVRRIMAVCYLVVGDKILLGAKKLRLGRGFWNGFGGRVELGESIRQTAIREMKEECGLQLKKVKKVGVVLISRDKSVDDIELHFFVACDYTGNVKMSDEMTPKWFSFSEIPYDQMWPSDIFCLPRFLVGRKVVGHFQLTAKRKLIAYRLIEVVEIPREVDFGKFLVNSPWIYPGKERRNKR